MTSGDGVKYLNLQGGGWGGGKVVVFKRGGAAASRIRWSTGRQCLKTLIW